MNISKHQKSWCRFRLPFFCEVQFLNKAWAEPLRYAFFLKNGEPVLLNVSTEPSPTGEHQQDLQLRCLLD